MISIVDLHVDVEELEPKVELEPILHKIPKYDQTDPKIRDNVLRIFLHLRPPLPPEEKPPQFIQRQSRRQVQKKKGKYLLFSLHTINNFH